MVALTTSLGVWQTRRGQFKAEQQAALDAAERAGPLSLEARDIAPASGQTAPLPIGRTLRLRGEFLSQATIYIDNRTLRGVAGFHVITPIRIEGSSKAVPVLRGWVARDLKDRSRLPSLPEPAGPVTVEGRAESGLARALELKASAMPGPGERLWQNFDAAHYRMWSGLDLLPMVVRQLEPVSAQDTLVREWRQVGADVDKHRGYAFQWFAMAGVSFLGLIYLVYRLLRRP